MGYSWVTGAREEVPLVGIRVGLGEEIGMRPEEMLDASMSVRQISV